MVNAEKVQGAVTFGIRPEGYCGKSRTSDLGPWSSGFRLPASGFRDWMIGGLPRLSASTLIWTAKG